MQTGDSPDVAGGHVTGTIADNKFAPDVFGCKAKWASAGNLEIALENPIPTNRIRVWVNLLAPVPLAIFDTEITDESTIIVQTWLLSVAAGPVFAETPTKYELCFGVSVIPE